MLDETFMVKFIDNEDYNNCMTIGKKYLVINEYNCCYLLLDDLNNQQSLGKARFEIVEEKKEVKKYTFKEVINNIKIGESYKSTFDGFVLKSITRDNIGIKFNDAETIKYCGVRDDQRFTKSQTTVTFLEAWKSYQEGKIIKSLETNSLYKKNEGKMFLKMHGWNDFKESQYGLSPRELEEQWIIYKSEDDN